MENSIQVKMKITTALLVWLLVFIIVLWFIYATGRGFWDSLIGALLTAFIVLLVIRPMTIIDFNLREQSLIMAVYAGILFLTPVLIALYVYLSIYKNCY